MSTGHITCEITFRDYFFLFEYFLPKEDWAEIVLI